MRGRLSARRQAALPRSLMLRLERMAEGETWEAAGEGLDEVPNPPEPEARPAMFFGFGVFAGTIIAGTAFMAFSTLALEPGPGVRNPRLPIALAAAAPVAPAPQEAQPVTFDVVIDRSQQAHARFGLRLAGTDDAGLEVILRNVPPAAQLSRGERRDDTTWVLKAADLTDLHLVLHEGAPEAFDVRIDVAAPPGMAATPTVARVRLVGSPAPAKSAAAVWEEEQAPPPVKTAAAVEAPRLPIASQSTDAGSGGKGSRPPRRAQPTVADASPPAAPAAVPQPRPWPEAASALGATSREWDRQVWWQMPPPSWSPFQAPAGQR